jgi:hypothetical protein
MCIFMYMYLTVLYQKTALSEAVKYLLYPMGSWLQLQVDCVEFMVHKVLVGQDFHLLCVSVITPPLLHTCLSPSLKCSVGLTHQHDITVFAFAGTSLFTWS